MTGETRYFVQMGCLYRSASSGKRWERTLHGWIAGPGLGFVQGVNEPCAVYNHERKLAMLSYCDDLMCRGRRSDIEWFFAELSARFDIRPPTYLSKDTMLDHLGIVLLEDEDGVYLSMQNYIEVMAIKLGVDTEGRKARHVPMSKLIEDIWRRAPKRSAPGSDRLQAWMGG